jgi:DNA-binding transcriptional regulator LsrR (DeoR family)
MAHVEYVNLRRNGEWCQADFHKWAKAQLKWRTLRLFAYNQSSTPKLEEVQLRIAKARSLNANYQICPEEPDPLMTSATDHNRLLVKIARLYYEQDMTQGDIGKRLRLSRQKVQRLVHQARDQGVVRIGIRPIMGIFSDLEKDLEERFGLREAVVVETSDYDNQPIVAREVGVGAADYLTRVVQPHDRIVLSWGGSLLGMVNTLSHHPKMELNDVVVIQGLGGLADPNNEIHAADLTRRLGRALGGRALLLPAPGVAGNQKAREAHCGDPHVTGVLQKARAATLAFMGIGAPRPDSILVQQGNIVTWQELATLKKLGAVGDINLRYFDDRGHKVSSDLDDRVIGLTLEEIRKINLVVGVAGGAEKFGAIRAALRGKLVDVLVTDHTTAQHLLESEASEPPNSTRPPKKPK